MFIHCFGHQNFFYSANTHKTQGTVQKGAFPRMDMSRFRRLWAAGGPLRNLHGFVQSKLRKKALKIYNLHRLC